MLERSTAAPAQTSPDARPAQAEPGSRPAEAASQQAQTPPGATPSSPEAQTPGAAQEGQALSSKEKNAWFRESFNRVRFKSGPPDTGGPADSPSEAPPESKPAVEPDGTGAQPSQGANGKPIPDAVLVTVEELNRRVQAETDRRLAKHQAEVARQRKADERKRLRETDPYAFAEQDRQEEQKIQEASSEVERVRQVTGSMLEAYDTTVLDPLMRRVPEADRRMILEKIDVGIPGRGQAAEQALTLLEKHWAARGVEQARKTLINDPGFVKEVLARYGGGHVEPDLVSAASAQRPLAFNMNQWLRDQGGRVRSR